MESSRPSCAFVVMDYINTTGKCLQLHYQWLSAGYLYIYLVGEDRQSELIATASFEQFVWSYTWKMLLVKLPSSNNLKQIVIVGKRTRYGFSGMAIDDIIVRSCSDLGM